MYHTPNSGAYGGANILGANGHPINLMTSMNGPGENGIIINPNADVKLFYDNVEKLATTTNGITVTGGVTADGFTLGDNENAQFGDSNDLKIFHNGSHSYIADLGTGDLRITGSAVHIQNAAQSENMIKCFENGSVQLYYDNSQKLGTAGWGVQIQGILKVLDATDANGSTNNLSIGSGNDLKLYHTGTNNHVDSVNGALVLRSDVFQLSTLNGTHVYINVPTDEQGVELYYDNVKRFETTSTGASVTGNLAVSGVLTYDDVTNIDLSLIHI